MGAVPMSKIVLALLTLILVDCWLGVYLDWRVSRPIPPDYIRFSSVDTVLVRDAAWELLKRDDPANTLALRGGDPSNWRVYATFTDSTHNVFFRGDGRIWRFVWYGHVTPWLVPSFLQR